MKKDIYVIIFSFLAWVICLGGCERDRNGDPIEIVVKNNSIDTVIFAIQFNFPDTFLVDYKTNISKTEATSVNPNSKSGFLDFLGWEKKIRENNSKETLIFVVYSLDTLRKYTFEQIQADYHILKRYDLSIEQLKSMDWTVTYQ